MIFLPQLPFPMSPSTHFNFLQKVLQITLELHSVCSLIIPTHTSKVQKQKTTNKYLISSRFNKAEIPYVLIIRNLQLQLIIKIVRNCFFNIMQCILTLNTGSALKNCLVLSLKSVSNNPQVYLSRVKGKLKFLIIYFDYDS